MTRTHSDVSRTGVAVVTADPAFDAAVREIFGGASQIDLQVIQGTLPAIADRLDPHGLSVIVADLDACGENELAALERIVQRIGAWPPVIAVTRAFNPGLARRLMQMRVADCLVKPMQPVELVRACARVARPTAAAESKEAQIHTFIPAVGGAGVTTLAIQTALLLMNAGARGGSTCLVDLDFQHGACADYLDLEPRLDLKEVEPRPDRLDRQLLEVMLAHHKSGLSVIAAPNRPAEMRSFDPDMVTRLLDLVSSNFDYVVIDMPRTWFSWTDSVLLGSNQLYIVSEMTVPSLRQSRGLVAAIRERLGDGPKPRVIVNRFEQRMFAAGVNKSDLEQTLGEAFAGTIPNNYRLVREAIDRGVPLDEVKAGNNVSAQLRRMVVPSAPKAMPGASGSLLQKLNLSWAR